MEWKHRPIDDWPGELTKNRRRADFTAGWGATLDLLDRELWQLKARQVVCQVALREQDFRLTDGAPKARAIAQHPGVILSFDSKYGPLRYACDTFDKFDDNVRAIALGLEALRKVDRYGISKDGQQYRGYNALGSGMAMGAPMSKAEAWRVLRDLADCDDEVAGPDVLFKMAVKAHHPDRGGDPDLFRRATESFEVLRATG